MNFNGNISINGLQTFTIFTAPAAGTYFVNGQLQIPRSGTAASSVQSVINQNGSPIYTGIAGATGFQVNQIVCASGDVIAAVLSSSAAPDESLNAVQGTVAFGNAF